MFTDTLEGASTIAIRLAESGQSVAITYGSATINVGAYSPRCDCGYVVPPDSKHPAAALRMHRRKAKQHQAVTA